MIAESMQRGSEPTVFHGIVNITVFPISSKVQELERELNVFKAKYVTLLSDKFKVILRGKLVYVQEVGLARRGGISCRPSWSRGRRGRCRQ